MYASTIHFDFLAITKNPSFTNRKPAVSLPGFPDENQLLQSTALKAFLVHRFLQQVVVLVLTNLQQIGNVIKCYMEFKQ